MRDCLANPSLAFAKAGEECETQVFQFGNPPALSWCAKKGWGIFRRRMKEGGWLRACLIPNPAPPLVDVEALLGPLLASRGS